MYTIHKSTTNENKKKKRTKIRVRIDLESIGSKSILLLYPRSISQLFLFGGKQWPPQAICFSWFSKASRDGWNTIQGNHERNSIQYIHFLCISLRAAETMIFDTKPKIIFVVYVLILRALNSNDLVRRCSQFKRSCRHIVATARACSMADTRTYTRIYTQKLAHTYIAAHPHRVRENVWITITSCKSQIA